MSNETGSPDGTIDARQIASAAMEILRDEGTTGPYYMSRLGTRLSAQFGMPLRQLLGSEKLSALLKRSLGNVLVFEGQGTTLTVRVDEANAARKQTLRYDPAIWAAFSKPIPERFRRFLRTERPFEFDDIEVGSTRPSSGLEIERERIPDANLGRPERDSHIMHQIEEWCERNGVPSAGLLLNKTTKGGEIRSAPRSGGTHVEVVVKFIEAIPVDERPRYSLPIDLLYRLLKQ